MKKKGKASIKGQKLAKKTVGGEQKKDPKTMHQQKRKDKAKGEKPNKRNKNGGTEKENDTSQKNESNSFGARLKK